MNYKNIEYFVAITQIEKLRLKTLNEPWGLIFDSFNITMYSWITLQNMLFL